MSTSEKKSLLNPVGKVSTTMQSMVDGSMIGIAQVDLSLAPVGTELFVQPSEGRLRLEVEVANANALGWKESLQKANDRLGIQRQQKRALIAFIKDLLDSGVISCGTRRKLARELVEG